LKRSLSDTAGKALAWVRENKIISLVVALLAGLVLLGNAADGIRKIVSPFFRATQDASEVARIRKEVEQQRDAIAIIARDANAARSEMSDIAALSKAAKTQADEVLASSKVVQHLAEEAAQSVKQISTTSDFAFLLARASADDRKGFDELLALAEQPSHPFHELAQSALVRIAGDFMTLPVLKPQIDWSKVGADPNTVDFEELKAIFASRPTFDQPLILDAMANLDRLPKAERLTFFRDVIKSTKSLIVLNAACFAMNKEAKIDKNIIAYRDYLVWWVEHIRDYTPAADPPTPPVTAPFHTPTP
jgi:hypothetical protein